MSNRSIKKAKKAEKNEPASERITMANHRLLKCQKQKKKSKFFAGKAL